MNQAKDRDRRAAEAYDALDHGLRPRVVILDGLAEATVEVIELPETADLGARFCHCGTRWEVTAVRTGNRVLIAKPALA